MAHLFCTFLIACLLEASEGETPHPTLNPLPKNFPVHLPEDSRLLPLAAADHCHSAVAGEVERLREDYARGGLIEPLMRGSPLEIKGRAIDRLFPNHRFFVFVWTERVKEPLPLNTPRPVGLLIGAHTSIAIDGNGVVDRFGSHWSIERSVDFLRKNRVHIRNADDAKLLWDALCEIYRRDRKGDIEKVSDDLWRVGIEKIDGERRFYEVRLSRDFSVQSIKAVLEKNP